MWKNSTTRLEETRSLHHPHIMEVKSIINRNGRSECIISQWADGGNLRDFYTSNPRPILEAAFVRAIIQQLTGLAGALHALHEYKKDEIDGASYRHGNLKPENILRFNDGSQVGVLKLYDMGWEKHHPEVGFRLYERLLYEPPEVILDTRAAGSQRRDMWSIGCIILELIAWLLYGTKELENLMRGMNKALQSSSPYWVAETDGRQRRAQIHPNVRACMDHIARDPECDGATAVGELLGIVRTQLLVVPLLSNAASSLRVRASAHELHHALQGMLAREEPGSKYWYTGTPRDGLPGPADSIPPLKLWSSSILHTNVPTVKGTFGGLEVPFR